MATKQKMTRRERRAQQQRQQRVRRWTALGGALLLMAFIVYFTWQQTAGHSALPAESIADPALGPPDAPVEIVEYGDFGCPACRAWHNSGIREQVLAEFGDQVRFVWRDFPVITAQSPVAAEAGHCAAAQGQFWAYHDHVYENFAGLDQEQLINYAQAVGLETEPFVQCLEQGQMAAKVRTNDNQARRLGLRGTPGFTVNGRVLPGPPSFEMLANLIRTELAE